MRWAAAVRERARGLLFKAREDAEMDEEMRFHLEMEAERLARDEGLDPREAWRRAAVAFGGVEKHREEVRDARGLAWVGGMLLDFRLGLRMLVKYPGLTLVGVLGMSVAIAIGAGFFAFMHAYVIPPLPLHEGERVVGIVSHDAEAGDPERRMLHDFRVWREELGSVRDLGAFRTLRRNLVVPGGAAEPVHVAEMTASGFRLPRVAPLLGRYLVEEDEREGAPPVVVIGHDVWKTRFAGDPAVVGREVRLGSAVYTVVGVMPEGFTFPVNHRFWVPLRATPSDYAPRQGPEIHVFGRLAPGATREQAEAELATLGRRMAAAYPRTHARLRPGLAPFTSVFSPISGGEAGWMLFVVQLLVSMLLVVVAVNVAVLVYARTAMRQGEISVRSALGASRRRIVAQLFAEALVLSAAAAGVGIVIARVALVRLHALLVDVAADYGGLPFWIEPGLSGATLLYVVGLVVVAAVIVGVVPALQATGRRLQTSLRELGGATGLRIGKTWTVLIVGQVAFAVAVLPLVVHQQWDFVRSGLARPGFAAEEYLSARMEMDRETPPIAEAAAYERAFVARYAERMAELVRRLEAEPAVAAVTFAAEVPGHESGGVVEVDGAPRAEAAAGRTVQLGRVDPGFFGAFGIPLLTGRSFAASDPGVGATAVVVNQSFVREFLEGGSALGRHVRYQRTEGEPDSKAAEVGRWYEIVGVVEDFPVPVSYGSSAARVYHPAAPGEVYPAALAVRLRDTDPAAFIGRLRTTTAAVDPTLRPHEAIPLHDVYTGGERAMMRVGAVAMTLLTLSVLLLSAAGIYALMSFAVTRRRREIGIRSALGADARRILASIFSRALAQLALGLVLGLAMAALLARSLPEQEGGGLGAFIPVVALLMVGVGLLAALGPARRGLRVQPMEALRAE